MQILTEHRFGCKSGMHYIVDALDAVVRRICENPTGKRISISKKINFFFGNFLLFLLLRSKRSESISTTLDSASHLVPIPLLFVFVAFFVLRKSSRFLIPFVNKNEKKIHLFDSLTSWFFCSVSIASYHPESKTLASKANFELREPLKWTILVKVRL